MISRRRTRAAIAGVAAALVVLALAVPTAFAAPVPGYYGVTSATKMEPPELARMAAGGITTLRVPLFWPHIEPRPPERPPSVPGVPAGLPEDQTRWGPTDAIVEEAARNGIRVFPFVYGSPDWVAGGDFARPPIDTPEARAAWQDFVGDLVRRYGPGGEFWSELALLEPDVPETPITDWQIWNEANSEVFWHPRPSPREYSEVMALAAEAIRAADPAASIVLGGMFGAPTDGIRAWDYLRRFHAAGATGTFDAYAIHPYAPDLHGIAVQVRRLRREIAAGPAPSAPLQVTEIGWPTGGPPDFNLVKSLRGQKRLLARSFRLFAETPEWNVSKVVWYVWRDNDVQPDCTVCSYSGLFTEGFEPKPAWRALAKLAGGTP